MSNGDNYNADFDLKNFKYVEGSFWAYPATWNMQGIGGPKASIGEEFVFAKRENMVENAKTPYNWEIDLHRIGMDTVVYAPNATVGQAALSCSFITEPTQIQLSFPADSAGLPYVASIGATGCWTAVYNSGVWEQYLGAGDNIQIPDPKRFEAWIFPDGTSQMDVVAWTVKYVVSQP
ncbi:MAG: hypothetical protein NT162_03835 [Candidatus Woesebacteria bacterium]|nr:hypothetical protein [Candidatus Woesebacteria bacterium]